MKASEPSGIRGLFAGLGELPDAEWEAFVSLLSRKTLAKGESWIQVGEPAHEVGFVLRGLIRAYYVTHDGGEFTLKFRTEGEIMASYSATLTGRPSEVAIQAVEETELATLSVRSMQALYNRGIIWQVIGRKLAEAEYIMRETRSYELLCLSAEERYKRFTEQCGPITGRLTQRLIASYIGINPVSLSRLLSKQRG